MPGVEQLLLIERHAKMDHLVVIGTRMRGSACCSRRLTKPAPAAASVPSMIRDRRSKSSSSNPAGPDQRHQRRAGEGRVPVDHIDEAIEQIGMTGKPIDEDRDRPVEKVRMGGGRKCEGEDHGRDQHGSRQIWRLSRSLGALRRSRGEDGTERVAILQRIGRAPEAGNDPARGLVTPGVCHSCYLYVVFPS